MLSQLKIIHADLRDAIAALESVTSLATPEDEALSNARLKLSRLSSRRRLMIENEILPTLRDMAPADAARVDALHLETAGLRVASSNHIGTWTMRAIHADWAGYQRASAEMRRSMLRRIEREAAILYPLLEAQTAA